MTLLKAAILSMLPISELRGGIPLAIGFGVNPFLAFFVCTLANMLIVPVLFFFLDNIHKNFLKLKFYEKYFNLYIDKRRGKLEKYIGTKGEFLALMLFVSLPLPVTGGYTGSILAWFFKVKRKMAYQAILLGVLIAGIVVTLTSVGLFSLF